MHILRRWWRFWLFLALSAALPLACAADLTVVTANERGAAINEAIDALSDELARASAPRPSLNVIPVNELSTLSASPPKLIIAMGSTAAQALLESGNRTPLLITLVPQDTYDQLAARRKASPMLSAIYLDQPVRRQLALLRLALPRSQTVALLLGPSARRAEGRLKSAAADARFQLVTAYPDNEDALHPHLNGILAQSDALLAIADPQIFNANTIQNILLTSFRARVPMLAFSPAYVKAGALLALYSTPRQIGTQAAAVAQNFLRGKPLPPAQYPSDYLVQVNPAVAASLGLILEENTLLDRLRQTEKAP